MWMADHDVENLRRSLAIGNGLPSDQIQQLLLESYRELLVVHTELLSHLEMLRPVIAQLRAELGAMHHLTSPRPTAPRPAAPRPTAPRAALRPKRMR